MNEAEDRLSRAILSEERRRLLTITQARSVSLVAIAILVSFLAPASAIAYIWSLLAIFVIAGWLRYYIARSRFAKDWHSYAFVFFDFALITFATTFQNPFTEDVLAPQMMLRFDNFVYLYVLLAALAISLRPRLLIWGGVSGVVCSMAALYWLASLPDTVFDGNPPPSEEAQAWLLALDSQATYVNLGVAVQNMVVYLIVAALLAVATEASLRLARKQVVAERRFSNMSRYVAVEAVEEMAERDDPFGAEDEREAAILFTDIVGFSSLAEGRPPRDVIKLLREAHDLVAREVFAHGGVLDKFIGDGAMATFGAVRAQEDAAKSALACAAAIQSRLSELSRVGGSSIRMAVGVHYGPVVVGDVGSSRRMELAVIGDTVNVAARLEEMTRSLGVVAAVSDEAHFSAGRPDGWRSLGAHPVAGRAEPVTVWALDP